MPDTALVTGATSGLGRAVAQALAERGLTVLVHGRSADRLDALVAELRDRGADARPYLADLASLTEVQDLADRVTTEHDQLHLLINNAGAGSGVPGSGRRLSSDGHELCLAVNYLTPYVLTRRLLPLLRASAPARVVNVGSIGQDAVDLDDLDFAHGYDGMTAYCRSKAALTMFTFDLAEELAGTGVRVNVLHPATFMDTGMVREAGHPVHNSVATGTDAVLHLAVAEETAEVTGAYYDVTEPARAHPQTYDRAVRERLREATEKLVGG
jgi:NAD(P)-dependent dehydrogenase (short-subunit alcohol dehydrogenase family)